MKRIVFLLLLLSPFCLAEDVTVTRSAVLKAERTIVSLKTGTVVELLERGEKLLTVRYGKLTGTIPVASVAKTVSPAEPPKKAEPAPSVPPRGATTNYGKAVEKAKENAAKHEKSMVKPTDEILQ